MELIGRERLRCCYDLGDLVASATVVPDAFPTAASAMTSYCLID